MPVYVWQAKDSSGKTVLKEITANTPKESQDILLADGYTDLALKEEDVMSAVQAGFADKPTMFGEEIETTAEDRVKYQDKAPQGFFSVLLRSFYENKVFFLLILGFAAWSGYRGHWVSFALLLVALLAFIAFILCLSTPLVYYQRLIKASDWDRWDEVLSLLDTLKSAGKFSFVKVPESELIRNRAKAIVGQGRLAEGLKLYQQCEGRPDCPGWLYKLFVASLYTTAKQYDKAIEYNLASIAEKNTPTAWADLSYRYARYKRNPAKAKEAMAEADKEPMAEVAKPFRIRCLGVIAYLEGNYAAAKSNLETAIEMVEKKPSRPYRDGHLSVARAFLCCVLAKQGDLPAAKQCFAQAKAYLVATQETELIAECQQLIGRQ
jgi:tetratricopeptide (TPR) repeat protein